MNNTKNERGKSMIIPFASRKAELTSRYGMRTLKGVTKPHDGYDLVGIGSKDVVAVEGGVVVYSRIITDKSNDTWEWGNYVVIRTASGKYHYYCHLESRAVSAGQTVKAGDKLGVMGNTGYSFGIHLHFEVRQADGRTPINPEYVLGIPNKFGTYETTTLDDDLKILVKHGVINTPAYWKQNVKQLKYLDELIHNMAEVLEK